MADWPVIGCGGWYKHLVLEAIPASLPCGGTDSACAVLCGCGAAFKDGKHLQQEMWNRSDNALHTRER